MKKVSVKKKKTQNAFKPVEFDEGAKGNRQIAAFKRKCRNPKFVAECLVECQSWRRGKERYKYEVVPKKNAPMPFCPLALGIVEDAAIRFLMNYYGTVKNGKIVDLNGTIHG